MSDCTIDAISKRNVFSAKLFTVDEVTIKLKQGKTVVHHVVERHPTVVVIPVTDNNEIYLVQQYRYTLGKDSLELMAGFINEKEAPLDAAKRELREETGIEANNWQQVLTPDIAGSVIHSQMHMFVASGLHVGQSHPEEDENIQIIKISLTEAVDKVIRGEITTLSSIAGILYLANIQK